MTSETTSPGRSLPLALFGILLVAFVIAGLGNALHKGGDFTVSLEAGHRFLNALPLYEGSSPGAGVTGPPFQGMWFATFSAIANVHIGLVRILWYFFNVAWLLAGVWCWTHAVLPNRFSSARELWSSSNVLLPFLAIALPAQTNFEHQNMNALLLFLTGAGAMALVRHTHVIAGGFLGTAVALKAFPMLLLAPLVVRRSWRAATALAAFAAGLTTLALARYGPTGGLQTLQNWIGISLHGGWPTRAQNQSLFSALSRSWPGNVETAHQIIWFLLVALVVFVSWKRRDMPSSTAGIEIAFVLVVAVVLSPIAWEHYWVLVFPALQVTYASARRVAFWVAALLITGPSPLLVGESGYDLARAWSNSTIAGILLIAVLAPELLRKKDLICAPGNI